MNTIDKKSRKPIDILLIKRSLVFLKPHKIKVIFVIMFTIAALVVGLQQPLIFGKLVDFIIKSDVNAVFRYILIIFFLIMIDGTSRLIADYFIINVSNKIIIDLRMNLYCKILQLPVSSFDHIKKGEFISRFEGDINILAEILTSRFTGFLVDTVKITVIGIIIFRISIPMSLALVFIFPITYFVYVFFGKRIKKNTIKVRNLSERYISFLQESLIGIRDIKQMFVEKIMRNKMEKIQNDFLEVNKKKLMQNEFANYINNIISAISLVVLILIGVNQISIGAITLGGFIAFNNYSNRFSFSLQNFTSMYAKLQETLVSMKRIFDLFDQVECAAFINNDSGKIASLEGDIELNNIVFGYSDDKMVLDHVSVNLYYKKINAITGTSGIGKTTLLELLLSFYKPIMGDITINNINISDIDRKVLLKNIAYVQQEPFFFNISIRENLLLSNMEATDLDIINACKKSGIHDYIYGLKEGYDTCLNEMSSNLSIGQKKRLAIARAIVKKPIIYLFDEPTATLDGESKKIVINLILELVKESTIIVISHDNDMINACDYINELDKDNYFTDKINYRACLI